MKKLGLYLITFVLCLTLCACGSVEKICEECGGEKSINCSECGGNGKISCPEEDCKNGIIGTSCGNCAGREEIKECSSCDGSGKDSRLCETCGGKGEVTNPITWQKFECGECGGLGQAAYTCNICEGYGLICTYCRNDVTSKYHPYYVECETCSGNGKLRCETCKGAKKFPCSVCSAEEYQEFMTKLEEENNAEEIAEKENQLMEEAKAILLSKSSVEEVILTKSETDAVKELLQSYEGSFSEKETLLKEVEIVEQYCNSKWEYVSGDDKLLIPSDAKPPYSYEIQIGYDGEDFYVYIIAKYDGARGISSLELKTEQPYIFVDFKFGYDMLEVYESEEGNLIFQVFEYFKDEPVNSLEIRRVTE